MLCTCSLSITILRLTKITSSSAFAYRIRAPRRTWRCRCRKSSTSSFYRIASKPKYEWSQFCVPPTKTCIRSILDSISLGNKDSTQICQDSIKKRIVYMTCLQNAKCILGTDSSVRFLNFILIRLISINRVLKNSVQGNKIRRILCIMETKKLTCFIHIRENMLLENSEMILILSEPLNE